MEDLTSWGKFISNVGFPIVAYLLLFWFSVKVIRENSQVIRELKDQIENLKDFLAR